MSVLDERIRLARLRVNSASTGVSIVPIVRPDAGSGSQRERTRYLANLNQGDTVLLHRILTQRVPRQHGRRDEQRDRQPEPPRGCRAGRQRTSSS